MRKLHPAEPFAFFTNWSSLLANDLIKGGDINNAIVVVDKPVTKTRCSVSQKFLTKKM